LWKKKRKKNKLFLGVTFICKKPVSGLLQTVGASPPGLEICHSGRVSNLTLFGIFWKTARVTRKR
jgi:hypothetical protein